MIEAVVFLDDETDSDDGYQRQCVAAVPNGHNELVLSIYGPDQSATEFLTREQWQIFVRDVNNLMGWSKGNT
jgi:hypothetical protein